MPRKFTAFTKSATIRFMINRRALGTQNYPFFCQTGQLQKSEILNRKQFNNRKKGSGVKDMIKSLLYELIQDNGLLYNIVCSAAAHL